MGLVVTIIVGLAVASWASFILYGVFSKYFGLHPDCQPPPRSPTTTEEQYREYFSTLYEQEVDRIQTLDQIRRTTPGSRPPPRNHSTNQKGLRP